MRWIGELEGPNDSFVKRRMFFWQAHRHLPSDKSHAIYLRLIVTFRPPHLSWGQRNHSEALVYRCLAIIEESSFMYRRSSSMSR